LLFQDKRGGDMKFKNIFGLGDGDKNISAIIFSTNKLIFFRNYLLDIS
jgi:hypothetical protein